MDFSSTFDEIAKSRLKGSLPICLTENFSKSRKDDGNVRCSDAIWSFTVRLSLRVNGLMRNQTLNSFNGYTKVQSSLCLFRNGDVQKLRSKLEAKRKLFHN